MEQVYHTIYQSPFGSIHLASADQGLCALFFDNEGDRFTRWLARHFSSAEMIEDVSRHQSVIRQLEDYLAGRVRQFDCALDLRGTEFQQRVWRELMCIPYGETRTYAEIARAIGHPKAVRAVGAANGANPISIIVPCHRVIGSNGALTGYGGGLHVKEMLLKLEKGQGR